MNARAVFFSVALLAFSALTAWCFIRPDLLDIALEMIKNPVGLQVSADLIVSMSILLGFIWKDARKRGISPLPYVLFGLTCGSFSPLLYMIHRELRPER
jgi:hypothetical protein